MKTKRSSSVRVAIAVAVLAIVVVAGLSLRWWTHPTLFDNLGDSFRARPLPVANAALSTTVIFPQVDGEPETVTIDGLHAIFSENTAQATATFSICHMHPGEDPIGAVHDPTNHCADIVPVEDGTDFQNGVWPDSDYLFVTITPTKAGIAHLERVEVRYSRDSSHLYQRGPQSIRVDRTVTAD